MAHIRERGDVVWLNFNPQTGHKQTEIPKGLPVSGVVLSDQVKTWIGAGVTLNSPETRNPSWHFLPVKLAHQISYVV
jgi:hypothetical protein